LNQFLRFCAVGTVGFVIDAGILQLLVLGIGMSPYLVRIISFLVAASATWLMNRHYTFKVEHRATHSEWARYIALIKYSFKCCVRSSSIESAADPVHMLPNQLGLMRG
jgi:putative flippase GtrA